MKAHGNSGDWLPGKPGQPAVCLFAPELDLVAQRAIGSCPDLERLLGRGRSRALGRGPWATLRALLGVGSGDIPVAPVSFAGEVEMPAGACLRLAPVGGRPEEGELGTVSAAGLGLSQEEATALATAFDTTLGDGAISMHAPDPRRWYLHGIPEWAGLAEPGMGSGAPAEPGLMRLLSEIEMLFFQHPVNRTRAETGRPLITGVQAWGGGRLPGRVPGGLPVLAGGEPWLRGLAALAGSRLETDAAALGDGGLAWPVPPEEADETLPRRLDEAWCAPLLELLGRRRLRSVALVTRRQVFSISPVSLRLPWRRRRSLQEALC